MAPLLALSWELLARQRWATILTAAYLALLCTAVPLVPQEWRRPELAAAALAVLGTGLIFCLVGLAHGTEARLESRGGGLPRHLFLLPVPTWSLAAPPILLGAIAVGGGWALVATCVLRPCGIDAAMVWPAMLAMTCLVWVQALCWAPLPSGWLRAPLFGLLVTLAALTALAGPEMGMPVEWLYTALGVALLLGQLLAGAAFKLARHGAFAAEGLHGAPLEARGQGGALVARTSPLRAQVWLEWRSQGWPFLVLIGTWLPVSGPIVHLGATYLQEPAFLEGLPSLRGPIERFGSGWVSVAQVVIVLLFYSCIYGAEMGRMSRHHDGPGVSTLLLTMPLPTVELVRAKLLTAAIIQAASWGATLVLGLVWAFTTGHGIAMSGRLVQVTGSSGAALVVFAGGLLSLGVICWLTMASGMWMGLAGWRNRAGGPVLLEAAFWIALLVCLMKGGAGHWIAPTLVAVALGGKVVAIVVVSRRVVVARLLACRTVGVALLAWAGVAAVVAGTAGVLFGTWLAVGLAVLLLPVARLLLAPLALHRARHA